MAACPWCSAPREASAESCPRCGANYAKAEQIKAQGRAATPAAAVAAAAPVPAMPAASVDEDSLAGLPEVDDPVLEWRLCIGAIPAALALGVLFHYLAPGLQRIFLAMPVHELGHAAAAWFTGYWAIPTLWKTLVAEERGFVMPLVLAGAIGWMTYGAWRRENRGLVALGAMLLLLQAFGTLVLRPRTAEMLFTWGGDGVGMMLATALMCAFFFGKDTQLYKGSLRWGFLVIGAAAFTDMFSVWWAARSDFGRVPFGEMEGVGLSDATKLVDLYGWEAGQMIRRYVATGIACLAVLAAVYAWGVRQAGKRIARQP